MIRCICALFLVMFTATSPRATEAFAVVGTYGTEGGDVMAFVTATDLTKKAAIIAVAVHRLDKPTVRLDAGFPGGPEDWHKFEQLWLKARRTAPPPKGAKDTEIGDYFDRLFKTQITVSLLSDGSVEFVFVGKVNGELLIGMIKITSKDLESFDRDVKKVTDYFKD